MRAICKGMLAVALVAGCSGGDKGGSTDTGGGGGGVAGEGGDGGGGGFSDYINTSVSPTGDFGDFAAGYDAVGAWLSQTPDPAKVETVPLSGKVEDFESGDGVAQATVEVFYADAIGGVPDVTATSDSTGAFSSSIQTCTPLAYKTATDPALQDTKNTFELHSVYGYEPGGLSEAFNSVSWSTYALIPSLLGVSIDPARGTAAGTAYDIAANPIQGAQVIVVDAAGDPAPGVVVKYFVDDFPNRDQPETSPDGLWVAINIPTGEWFVDMYVADGAGGHLLMGRTNITVFADSINISNVYTGFDGVKYPDSCLAAR
jgi:hypothetical protein